MSTITEFGVPAEERRSLTVRTCVLEDFQLDVHVSGTPGRDGGVVSQLEVTPRHDERTEPAWITWVSFDGGWLTLTAWSADESAPRFVRRVYVGPVPYDGPMGVETHGDAKKML